MNKGIKNGVLDLLLIFVSNIIVQIIWILLKYSTTKHIGSTSTLEAFLICIPGYALYVYFKFLTKKRRDKKMGIPEDIKNAIDNGTTCPLCKQGPLMVITRFVRTNGIEIEIPKLICGHCGKDLVIKYEEEPFKIINIEEKLEE